MDEPILLYDGHCRFCRVQANRLRLLSGKRIRIESFQDPGVLEQFPLLSKEAVEESMQLVMPDHMVHAGAEAAAEALKLNPPLAWAGELYKRPLIKKLADRLYAWVARNRYRFGGTCTDEACAHSVRALVHGPSYFHVGRIFFSLLGIIHFIAFASLAIQIRLLIGRHGLMPIGDFLQKGKPEGLTFWQFPTLFWWNSSDTVLLAGACIGMALSILLIFRRLVRPVLIGLLLLYLSYVTAGRDFFSFQWDALLLESTFLALFLSARASNRIVVFLFRFLLFKLYFESGLSKIGPGSQGWRDLSAMMTYYETAPLPTWIGWYFHQLPIFIQKCSALATLVIELLVPWLIFSTRRLRRKAFWIFTVFQILIVATANYGFFNYLAFSLQIFLADDRSVEAFPWLMRLFRLEPHEAPRLGAPPTLWHRSVLGVVALFVLSLSFAEYGSESFLKEGFLQTVAFDYSRVLEPWRIVNVYHLFGSMTIRRIEIEIQGTLDEKDWEPYEWKYKPGDIQRRPPIVAPYQPRVDFLAWFLTLGGSAQSHDYLGHLLEALCRDPASVSSLFRKMPFGLQRPKALRIAFYQYHFTDYSTRRETGAWWVREFMGLNAQEFRCADAS